MSEKPKPKPKPVITTTKYKDGQPVSSVTVDRNVAAAPEEETRNRAYYRDKAQFSRQLLRENPDLFDLITKAIKGEWEMDKFWTEYNKTAFAQARSKAQEEFDIGMSGPNADTYKVKVEEQTAKVKQAAQRLGIQIDDAEAARRATEIVRDGIENNATLAYDAYFSKRYLEQAQAGGAATAQKPMYGTASEIQRQLEDAARSYGLKMDPTMLQAKTGEALGQGERWNEYVQNQALFFRDQAKLMYPKSASLFDTYTLTQIAEPYLSEAGNLLGLSPAQMDLTDPKWSAFLAGENGPLSKDEWVRVLKTDPKYGWDRSTRARQEFASIGDELLSAFGMA